MYFNSTRSELFLLSHFPVSQGFFALSSGSRLVRNLQKPFWKACPIFSDYILSTEIHALFASVGNLIILDIIILIRQDFFIYGEAGLCL